MNSLSHLVLMQRHVETLFIHDNHGRLVFTNEPWQPENYPAPLVFVGRTNEGFVCRCRHDLPEELCVEVAQLARQFAAVPLDANALMLNKMRQYLELAGWEIDQVREGPAYYFPTVMTKNEACVIVNRTHAEVLHEHFADLVDELDAVQPCVAILVNGSAIANCRTVRRSSHAVEAGVNTAPAYRRRGLGAKVVATWAATVQSAGLRPMYSTSSDNAASKGLAAKLGLVQYGIDLQLS